MLLSSTQHFEITIKIQGYPCQLSLHTSLFPFPFPLLPIPLTTHLLVFLLPFTNATSFFLSFSFFLFTHVKFFSFHFCNVKQNQNTFVIKNTTESHFGCVFIRPTIETHFRYRMCNITFFVNKLKRFLFKNKCNFRKMLRFFIIK